MDMGKTRKSAEPEESVLRDERIPVRHEFPLGEGQDPGMAEGQ
jgi:hypothetical protein